MENLEEYGLWEKYPQHRNWFNKLYLSLELGHYCGPSGTAPKISDKYVIRPTYNLAGMGLGAKVEYIQANDRSKTPPGYFWCRYYEGDHVSASYLYLDGHWVLLHAWKGINSDENLSKFIRWVKLDTFSQSVPSVLDCLKDVPAINLEFKGSKVIEVHLRGSGCPDGSIDTPYKEFIPVWETDDPSYVYDYTQQGYTFIEDTCDMSDVTPYISEKRIGFLAK